MAYGTVKADSVENSSGATVDLTAITTDNATTSAAGYMSAADKSKLDGIDLSTKADLVGGKLSTSQIPDLAVTEYKGDVADQTAMLAVSGQKGDWVTRQDDGKVYIITGDDPTSASDWAAISYPASAVQSVAGKTGAVTLAYSDLTGTPDITKVEIDSEHEITNGSTAGSGSNLILNGDWATQDSTNWSAGNANYTELFNQGGYAYLASVSGNGDGDWQSFTTVAGTTYALSLDTYFGPGYKIIDGNGLSGTVITSATSADSSGTLDTLTTTFTASSTTTTLALQLPSDGATYAFDNASVTEVLDVPTLKLGSISSSDTYASFLEDGGVTLYYDNSVKLETTSAGVDVTGSLTTTSNVDVTGSITATGNVTAYSDVSLKENIEVIPGALEKVEAIRGVTYDRKDIEGARHAGVIAQEVEAVLPEVVMTDAEGLKSVAYGNLVGLLIEAVKELKAEVETLKQERN